MAHALGHHTLSKALLWAGDVTARRKEGTVVALRKLSVSRGFRLNRGSWKGVKRPRRCEEGANAWGVRLEITGHL